MRKLVVVRSGPNALLSLQMGVVATAFPDLKPLILKPTVCFGLANNLTIFVMFGYMRKVQCVH